MHKVFIIVVVLALNSFSIKAQLNVGSSSSEVNFREGPGTHFNILHTIKKSDLLVILPTEKKNDFVEVFDVETNSRGFVYEKLIHVRDTLKPQKQNYFEKSGENANRDVQINLINRTQKSLYIWINNHSYHLSPYEMKVLLLPDENITYFSSSPGIFPIYGKETLQKGNVFNWNFSL